MSVIITVILCLTAVVSVACQSAEPRGIQLRITQKGLDYTISEAVKILIEDVKKMKLNDFSGESSGVKFSARNLHLKSFHIGSNSLRPDYKKGLTAALSDASVSLKGEIKYEKKIGWIKIRDTVNVDADASGVSFSLSLHFGRTSTGHPTVDVNWCNSNVGSLKLHFSGSRASWLYNLLRSFVEKALKKTLADLMCKAARDSIEKHAKKEMEEFQTRATIDKYSILDYSLTSPPSFDYNFMDVFVKGEFLDRNHPTHHSSLPVPSFEAAADNSKMLYFWLTDYTLNTAGEVYHNSGILSLDITSKSKIPYFIKSYLNTFQLGNIFPKLKILFPKLPVQIKLYSYKAPKVTISKGQITLFLYADADFQVVLKSGKLVDVFTLVLDISAAVTPVVTAKSITGKLNDFSLDVKIGKSEIGKLTPSKIFPLINSLVKAAIIRAANSALNKGMPLPNLNEVQLIHPGILIMPNVVRISTDCVYVRK